MAFTNFTTLKQAIIDYTHRRDLDLRIQDFITLAEHEMYNNADAPLRIKQDEKTSTLTAIITTRFLDLPTDYESMRSTRLDIVNESDFLEFRTPQQLVRFDDTGRPCFFTIIGTKIEFDRVPDEAFSVDIQYFSKTPALTLAAPTNDLLTNHPNIYLFGSVYQAFIFAKDNQSAGAYKALFVEAIQGANKADKKGRYGPAPVMKVQGSTP